MSDSVGSVSVEVVPDARGWSEKLRAQIRDTKVTVNADADTTEAETQLDEVARTRTAKVKADVSEVSKASAFLDRFIGQLGLIPTLAITAGSALIPLAASLGGVAIALAAPLAIAGGGATLFGFLGAFAVKDTEKQLKTIDSLQKKLDGLTKGTADYARTQKELTAAQKALSPAQSHFLDVQSKLGATFQKFIGGKAGSTLLNVIAQGMTVLMHILPLAAPIITSVGGALSSLLGGVDKAAQSPSFSRFVGQFAKLAGRDIRLGGHILGDLATGVGSLVVQLDKHLSGDVLHGISRLAGSFADWASSKSARHEMHDFIDYFHKVGPQVASTIGHVATALGHIVKALAPLGPPVLHIISGIARAIGGIPIPVLTALAAATGGLVAFQKLGGFKATSLLTKGLGSGGGVGGFIKGMVDGGVQKVYVVNMPGSLGKGGIPIGAPEVAAGETAAEVGAGAGLGSAALALGLILPPFIYGAQEQRNQFPYGRQHANDPGTARGGVAAAQKYGTMPTPAPRTYGRGIPVHDAVTGYAPTALPDSPHLKSVGTALDALRQHAQQAQQQIDQIGPVSAHAFAQATNAAAIFAARLNAIHDKKIAVILNDQAAVNMLEAVQAYRLQDKSFSIYAHYRGLDRTVGPGGGIGVPTNNNGGGASSGSGGGASAGPTPVHVHLDANGRTTLTGYMHGTAQDVYNQNQKFAGAHQ